MSEVQGGEGGVRTPEGGEDAWKRSTATGIVAALLIVASILVIGWFLKREKPKGVEMTFICEPSGQTFNVEVIAGDPASSAYEVDPEIAVPCKLDGKQDAYMAWQDDSGRWRKLTRADLATDVPEGMAGDAADGASDQGIDAITARMQQSVESTE
jgi:hypothetical protein